MRTQNQNIIFANTLRGVAALLVLISHHWGLFWNDRMAAARFSGLPAVPECIVSPYMSEILRTSILPINLGALGVSIFFLISGFVIPFSLVHQTRAQFAIARFFRLWPTYLVGFLCTLTCILVGVYWAEKPLPFPVSAIWPHMILGLRGLLQSQSIDAIVWTLEIEIGFYFLIAFTIKSVSRASLLAFVVPILFLITVILMDLVGQNIREAIYGRYIQKFIGFSPFFIYMYIGVAFNFYYRKRIHFINLIILALGLLIAAIVSNLMTTKTLNQVGPSYLLGLIIFIGFMFIPFLQNWSPRAAYFFSMISYPLYVIHAVIGYILLYFLVVVSRVDSIFALFLTFLIVIALALLIHCFIEVPSQRMGKALASNYAGPK